MVEPPVRNICDRQVGGHDLPSPQLRRPGLRISRIKTLSEKGDLESVAASVGCERTYSEDLVAEPALREALERIVDIAWQRIEGHRVTGRTVTLKVKFEDFRQITRARSCEPCIARKSQFRAVAASLLDQVLPVPRGVRLLGLTLSGLSGPETPGVAEPQPRGTSPQRAFDF